ncbi:MAG: cupin domain-containing protein [Kiritimatiellia bacterium]
MKKMKKAPRKHPRAPVIKFPGGHVQIVNPRHPIKEVWSDVLFLNPGGELPTHVHDHISSLLICLSGNGLIAVDGKKTRLKSGVCVFISAGAEHRVKASANSRLTCLSINTGIIQPGKGADIKFKYEPTVKPATWDAFSTECGLTAAKFRDILQNDSARWNAFQLKL